MNVSLKKITQLTFSLALAGLFGLSLFLIGFSQTVPVAHAAGETCFVSLNNSGITDYQSADASAVQAAINAASPGDTLKIAGTCTGVTQTAGISQTAYISQSLTLRGGYTTTNWTVSDLIGNPTTLDAEDKGRVVYIPGAYTVTLKGLTLTGGNVNNAGGGGDSGSGIFVSSGAQVLVSQSAVVSNTNGAKGVGIRNNGILTVTQSIIAYNTGSGDGGGFANFGKLTVVDTAMFNNKADDGGVLQNFSDARFVNSTLSGNQAGGGSNGGAIEHWNGTLWLTHTTIANNAGGSGDGIYVNQVMTATNSIFDNGPDDCRYGNGVFNDGGYNIEGADTCGLSATTSLTNTDPLLDVLADNGGPDIASGQASLTHAFLDNSPALDAVPAGNCPLNTDQRGFGRPYNTNCDVGAYEFHPPVCFVEATGDNTTDYSSMDASALQQAIDDAGVGITLKIAGTCAGVTPTAGISQTAYINKNLTLQGGYTTTNWLATPNPDTYPTTLSAENLGRVVLITATATAQVENLILRNGEAANGAGLYVDTAAGLNLLNSQVMSNTATGSGFTDGGGGLGNLGTTVISGTMFSYNSAVASAGAVGNGPSGVLTVENSTFSFNNAFTAGGLGNTGRVNITASRFISNTANGAGAVGNLKAFGGTGVMFIENSTFLTNAVTKNGGAIDNDGGELHIIGSSFTSNHANRGAGVIHNNKAVSGLLPTLYITNTIFMSNTAGQHGGILYSRGGPVSVYSSTLAYNTAEKNGGAILVEEGALTLISTTLKYNQATTGQGGGMHIYGPTTVIITNSLILSNSAALNGGGISNGATLSLSQVEILSNTAQSEGGGLLNYSGGIAEVSQSTFNYNQATNGGGIDNQGQLNLSDSSVLHNFTSADGAGITTRGIFTLARSTVAYNIADDDGGGLLTAGYSTLINSTVSHNQALGNNHNVGGGGLIQIIGDSPPEELHLIHTTITSNTANSGDGIYLLDGPATFTNTIIAYNGTENCALEGASSFSSGGYNLEDANTCNLTAGSDITATNPLLAELADNGGDTLTHALLPGSPAIDAIPSGGSCPLLSTDQRDITRPQGGACDIGAVEMEPGVDIYLPVVFKQN